MTRDEAIALARRHAQQRTNDHGYLAGSDAPNWMPHDWVIDAVMAAASGAPADLRFSWMDFQQIADLPAVDESIRNLLDDPTEDNSTCMIRAICEGAADRLVALAATQATAVGARTPDGWRIEFGVDEVALHQRGTAQPTHYPKGTVEYALLCDISAGAQVESPDLLRMVLDDLAVCMDVHGEHSTEVWESKELGSETVEALEALRRKLKACTSKHPVQASDIGKAGQR